VTRRLVVAGLQGIDIMAGGRLGRSMRLDIQPQMAPLPSPVTGL
jgi:hypothetical protein